MREQSNMRFRVQSLVVCNRSFLLHALGQRLSVLLWKQNQLFKSYSVTFIGVPSFVLPMRTTPHDLSFNVFNLGLLSLETIVSPSKCPISFLFSTAFGLSSIDGSATLGLLSLPEAFCLPSSMSPSQGMVSDLRTRLSLYHYRLDGLGSRCIGIWLRMISSTLYPDPYRSSSQPVPVSNRFSASLLVYILIASFFSLARLPRLSSLFTALQFACMLGIYPNPS